MATSIMENGGFRPLGRKPRSRDYEEQGKLFVGGLSWDTTQETLLHYFSRFGEVIDCVVMKRADTGRSRGFGFVTFSDPSHIDDVIASCPHTLDERTIDPKSCNPRSMQKPKKGSLSSNFPKIFLGGLPSNITETDLRSFFSKYGEVCQVVIMYDQERKKSRGFGFLSFTDEMSVYRACLEHFVNIQNKQVEIKRAEPRAMTEKDIAPDPQWIQFPSTTSPYSNWGPLQQQQQQHSGSTYVNSSQWLSPPYQGTHWGTQPHQYSTIYHPPPPPSTHSNYWSLSHRQNPSHEQYLQQTYTAPPTAYPYPSSSQYVSPPSVALKASTSSNFLDSNYYQGTIVHPSGYSSDIVGPQRGPIFTAPSQQYHPYRRS